MDAVQIVVTVAAALSICVVCAALLWGIIKFPLLLVGLLILCAIGIFVFDIVLEKNHAREQKHKRAPSGQPRCKCAKCHEDVPLTKGVQPARGLAIENVTQTIPLTTTLVQRAPQSSTTKKKKKQKKPGTGIDTLEYTFEKRTDLDEMYKPMFDRNIGIGMVNRDKTMDPKQEMEQRSRQRKRMSEQAHAMIVTQGPMRDRHRGTDLYLVGDEDIYQAIAERQAFERNPLLKKVPNGIRHG